MSRRLSLSRFKILKAEIASFLSPHHHKKNLGAPFPKLSIAIIMPTESKTIQTPELEISDPCFDRDVLKKICFIRGYFLGFIFEVKLITLGDVTWFRYHQDFSHSLHTLPWVMSYTFAIWLVVCLSTIFFCLTDTGTSKIRFISRLSPRFPSNSCLFLTCN
jgi:hypothetical protein